jgi:O-antigen/teichoic acid export membrane protein
VILSVAKILVAELLARTKIVYVMWASVATALANVVGNLLLIPHLGISGAALASTVSYTLLTLVVVRQYLGETGVPWTTLVPGPGDARAYRAAAGGVVQRARSSRNPVP